MKNNGLSGERPVMMKPARRLFILAVVLISITGATTMQARSTDRSNAVTIRFGVHVDSLLQRHEGWGVSLCWWANVCGHWSEEKIDTLVDWLVSPRGLNFNIFRYNIGGGDDPLNRHCELHHMAGKRGKGLRAEMEGFQDSLGGSYLWERDAAQRKIMLKIRERRPDAIFEAFSNSCPYFMTYSGCVGGNDDPNKDNLRPECYAPFARYLVDVCKHYRDAYGLEFRTLEPFNEPVTDYWYRNGSQEGCHFDVSSQLAFLRVLKPVLDASGLRTVIAASDETNTNISARVIEAYRDSGCLDVVGQWNVHTYSADSVSRTKITSVARRAGKRLWMSETGGGGRGYKGFLQLAQRLIDDERQLRPDAWVEWQYVDEGDGHWSLVHADFKDTTFRPLKSFFIRRQTTQFIRQGYTFIKSDAPNTLAAISPARDTLVLVTVNQDTVPADCEALLSGAIAARAVKGYFTTETVDMQPYAGATLVTRRTPRGRCKAIRYRMPAQSIMTLLVPVKGNGKK